MVDGLIEGFRSETVDVDGVRIHYVVGGSGSKLLLIHGYPQDWYEWRGIMARLGERFTVIAPDLRGVGGSDAPVGGYDAATLARDLHGVVAHLGGGPVHVVGHDIGGWVAYAYARLHPSPDELATVMVLETLIPGVEPFAEAELSVPLWHGEFHMTPDLPEALIADRQAIYFRWFFDVGTRGRRSAAISDADVEHYARAYGDAAHLRAGFEVYRAIPANVGFNAGETGPVEAPLLLAGGEHVFGPALEDVATNLRANFGWKDVTVAVIDDGQHYLAEERPDDVIALIEGHSARVGR
jgi:pimeloyl-ACP methyl ester carboxylesterase